MDWVENLSAPFHRVCSDLTACPNIVDLCQTKSKKYLYISLYLFFYLFVCIQISLPFACDTCKSITINTVKDLQSTLMKPIGYKVINAKYPKNYFPLIKTDLDADLKECILARGKMQTENVKIDAILHKDVI